MKIINLTNGLKVVNAASGHPYNMEDGTVVPSCGTVLNATRESTRESNENLPEGVTISTITPTTDKEGLEFLSEVPEGVLVIGSLLAAQAYGFPVITLMPNEATESRDFGPAEKLMSLDYIGAFWN